MQLHEQYRPKTWADVVGQDKVIEQINNLRPRGLGGRAYWITGQSGTGKTTIARILASEFASEWCLEEQDAQTLTPTRIIELERRCYSRALGQIGGWAIIVNEAHGLSSKAVKQLLVTLEGDRVPQHVIWIFTTTIDGQESLIDGCEDSHPLMSRCTILSLSRRNLAEPFAERARWIADREGLNGKPLHAYTRLVKDSRNNLRAVLQAIEAGQMTE